MFAKGLATPRNPDLQLSPRWGRRQAGTDHRASTELTFAGKGFRSTAAHSRQTKLQEINMRLRCREKGDALDITQEAHGNYRNFIIGTSDGLNGVPTLW